MDKSREKKILYCASTASHLRQFHLPYLRGLREMGYRVTACAEKAGDLPFADEFIAVPFEKSLASVENVKNIFRIYRLLRRERFDIVSTHTTLASAIVRAAVLLLPKRSRPKVICTCHGYLFREKDGIRKWKYLLPEKICARVTDVLLVMNQEDYRLARRYRLYRGELRQIPGMGVDFSRFDVSDRRDNLRRRYGIAEDAVLFVFGGEFSARKNQRDLIDAFARAEKQMPDAKLILAGEGALLADCRSRAEQLGLRDKIIFPGQVRDMAALYRCCDVCVSASRSEGLPFNIMEAMYCGLACIASGVKGHRDLLTHNETGLLYEDGDVLQLAVCMLRLYRDGALRRQLGEQAKQAAESYRLERVYPAVMKIYEDLLNP